MAFVWAEPIRRHHRHGAADTRPVRGRDAAADFRRRKLKTWPTWWAELRSYDYIALLLDQGGRQHGSNLRLSRFYRPA